MADPQKPGAITGYQEQPPVKITMVNNTKEMENLLGDWMHTLKQRSDVDQRWLSIARTQLQLGFMAMNRAIFQPESRL